MHSQAHEKATSEKLKHKWTPTKDAETDKWIVPTADHEFKLNQNERHPFDMVQHDEDINNVQLDREPLLSWAPKAPSGHLTGYTVPNFGVDHDIKASHKNLSDAEKRLNHKWVVDFDKKEGPAKDYFVPDFGLATDINDSLTNLKNMEKKYGVWNLPKE